MTRPARVIIDPRAATHNLSRVRRAAPASRVMAVIKADAYGHGICRMARALDAADAFAVASLEEAVRLREAGVAKPIVLLEGPFEAGEVRTIAELRLEVAVHTVEQLHMLETLERRVPLWLKIDTGMHRLGFAPERLDEILPLARGLADPLRFMTHFASAHVDGGPGVAAQIACFTRALAACPGERSLANSAAILRCPQSLRDWVRPGLMLYGVSPFRDETGAALGLEPVMTLCSRLIAVHTVRAGEAVGYGGSFVCPEDMPIGVVAYGYGDGYPRHAKTGTPVLVNGVRTQVIGECSMDMMTVDLRPVARAKFGDMVTLWGAGLPIEEVARASGTIPYELLCRVRMRAHYEEGTP
jgi:alanine racemase